MSKINELEHVTYKQLLENGKIFANISMIKILYLL